MTDKVALAALRAVVDDAGWVDDPALVEPYLHESRGRYRGSALAVVRPTSTQQVAALVRAAQAHRIAIVPQGGNTGLVGGGMPYGGERAVLVSLQRMNAIRSLDPIDYTATVEAGCILASLQQAAAEAGRLFPLSLGAEGSCTLGGVISANAGGTMTIRYGNMRELVLGLEVVLPDGRIWDGLKSLRKNNTGYDLKQLFIGGEGTLGIVTTAVVKLFPKPLQVETLLIAVSDPAAAIALLTRLREAVGELLSAFELMPRLGLDFALRHVVGAVDPLAESHSWYVLAEVESSVPGWSLREAIEACLSEAFSKGFVSDAVFAASEAQRKSLWFLREAIVEAQKSEGGSIKHDISVPVSRIADFIARASAAVEAAVPGIRPMPFGHAGDGNIHFNLTQPKGTDRDAFMARGEELNLIVHDIALSMGGSISAEHGIGRFKRDEMRRMKDPVELDLMRRVKAALDPDDLMNPGVMLPD